MENAADQSGDSHISGAVRMDSVHEKAFRACGAGHPEQSGVRMDQNDLRSGGRNVRMDAILSALREYVCSLGVLWGSAGSRAYLRRAGYCLSDGFQGVFFT